LVTVTQVINTAIISRASTDHQGDTCEHQIMALQTWAKKLSGQTPGQHFLIQPQHIFVDQGVSAWKESILERPAVKDFLRAVELGEVRCLFIKGISRFNRDDADARAFFDALDGMGVRVKSLEEGFDSLDKGGAKNIFSIHSFLAQMESDKKSIAVKIGMQQKAKKGEWTGGIPPYGFQYNSAYKRLEPIDKLKPLILDIWELAAAGRGPSWIAHHLNERRRWADLDPRTWTTTMIQRMLGRVVYVGDSLCGIHNYKYSRTLERSRTGGYLFGKKKRILELAPEEAILVEDAHPGIVSRLLFQQVQQQMELRKRASLLGRRSPNARYPLTGLLFCGCCSGPMIHHGRNRAKGYQYYTCANRLRKGRAVCTQGNVRSDALHELILLVLEERLTTIGKGCNFWAAYKSVARSTTAHLRRLQEIDAEVEQSASNVTQLLTKTPNLSDTLRDLVSQQADQAIKRLQAEKVTLLHELDELALGSEDLTQLERDVDDLWGSDTPLHISSVDEALRELFHQWLKAITLCNGRSPGATRKKDLRMEWKIDVMLDPSRN